MVPESDIYQTQSYKKAIIKSNYEMLNFLLQEQIEFAIVIHIDFVDFNPPVPTDIIDFEDITMLNIANYTLNTAILNKDTLNIETGFGVENFGSHLSIPLEAIFQIAVEDELLALSYYIPKKEINSMDMLKVSTPTRKRNK